MNIPFVKYHGTGNDFIVIDDRNKTFDVYDHALVSRMCDRHFGIGADGLILIQSSPGRDFHMVYFNADGAEGSMCGNGARCAVALAKSLGMLQQVATFTAYDGEHKALVAPDTISVSMSDVSGIEESGYGYLVDTGSPHLVRLVHDPDIIDVVKDGRAIRQSPRFIDHGVNVNFVSEADDVVRIRTYERGVEDETLSCGTGAIAAAVVVAYHQEKQGKRTLQIASRGGVLSVDINGDRLGHFRDIWLKGSATLVFRGEYSG